MRNFNKQVLSTVIMLAAVAVVSEAQAYRNWHPRWGWGVGAGFVGGVVIASQYPRPYYYQPYPPPVVYQQPIVVQGPPVTNYQIPPPPVTSKPTIWYFCESENNFYPNVANCPEAWKPIQTDSSSAYTPQIPPPTVSVTR